MRNEVNRAHKAKTTLRYLLIVIGTASVLSVQAQGFAQMPITAFRSTSTMVSSGSAYSATPALNSDGTAAYSGSSSAVSGPRRAKMDDPDPSNPFINPGTGEPSTIGDVGNPNEPGTPIGDALIPLALLALMYVCVRTFRRRRALRE